MNFFASPVGQSPFRSTYFSSLYSNIPPALLPIQHNKCMCYTYNKPNNYIYKPHTDIGRVGTTSSSYLWQRKRI